MPKFFINLFKEFEGLDSSFHSFQDCKNLSDYYNLFKFLDTTAPHKIPSVIEIIKGKKFSLTQDQFGKPRAKYKIKKKPFNIKIYAYKVFFCEIPVRLDIHTSDGYAFYYRYTYYDLLDDEKMNIKNSIKNKYDIDPSLDLDKESVIDPNQTILKLEDGEVLKIHFYNYESKTLNTLLSYEHFSKRSSKFIIENLKLNII